MVVVFIRKKINSLKVLSLVSLLVSVFYMTQVSARDVVNLAIGDWPPYTSSTNPKNRLLEKIVEEAFKQQSLDVEYHYYPWKRSYRMVQKGEADGSFPWNTTEDRQNEFVIHKEPLIKDEGVYFHLKSTNFDWQTIDDLKQYRVGVTMGFKHIAIYEEEGIDAEAVQSELLNFKKLLSGRIDVYRTSKTVGYAMIKKHFTAEEVIHFTHHPKAIEETNYYVLFSKQSPNAQKLADTLDEGLKAMRSSGEYQRLLEALNE